VDFLFFSSLPLLLFSFFCLDPVDPIPFLLLLFPSLLSPPLVLGPVGPFSLSSLYFILGHHMIGDNSGLDISTDLDIRAQDEKFVVGDFLSVFTLWYLIFAY